jgi:hypothetical protein
MKSNNPHLLRSFDAQIYPAIPSIVFQVLGVIARRLSFMFMVIDIACRKWLYRCGSLPRLNARGSQQTPIWMM